MHRLRNVCAGLAGLMAAGCATDAPEEAGPHAWNTLTGAPPLIIAHRGASGHLPEHTLEAYALAIEQGADVIEPDLVFTKDGVLVARHDRHLSTTTNVADKPAFAARRRVNPDTNDDPKDDWWVEDFTLAELKTLRARQPFKGRSKEYDDQFEIPTFGEVLALVERKAAEAGRPVGVYPETKHPGYFQSIGRDFERPLLTALQGFRAGPVFIQSFEPEILKRLKGKTTAKLVQLVYEETPGAGPNISLEAIAAYADGVGPAKTLLIPYENRNESVLRKAHSLELLVHPWTFRDDTPNPDMAPFLEPTYAVNEMEGFIELPTDSAEAELAIFFFMGVDGVFTDFPDTAVKIRDNLAEK